MSNRIHVASLFFVAMITIVSCKDDESVDKEKTLTSKDWKISKFEVFGQDVTDEYFTDDCLKDDYLTFVEDGTLIQHPGTDDCDGGAQEEEGTWSFKENKSVLSVQAASFDVEGEIKKFTSSTIVISTYIDAIGFDVTVTLVAK